MSHRRASTPTHAHARIASVLAFVVCSAWSSAASAAPTLGFVEKWPIGADGWGGSVAITYNNPGVGGVDANDGFLRLTKTTLGNFGTRSVGSEYVGDWIAAGIDRVKVWLSDLNGDGAFEIHFSIGQATNLWQYDVGFVPPALEWAEFTVDLSDSASFTNIIVPIDAANFTYALRNVGVVHLRHDLAPYEQVPDPASGRLGIDHLALTNSTVGVAPAGPVVVRPLEMAAPSPNPSRGPVTFSLRVSDDSEIRVRVVDTQGRAVRTERLAGGAGLRAWTWDGSDDAGRRVPSGVYRAIAWTRAGGMSRSVVRVD